MTDENTTTVVVRVARLGEVRERIAKANKRLARAGIEERFELTVGEQRVVERRNEADIVTDRYAVVDVELATPQIGYNGWTFVATLSFEEAGTIVRTVPGAECSYRPASKVCDQCGTVRERRETFVVRNVASGEYKQIGRNCLALFFGLKPSLWVYEVELSEYDDDDERGAAGSRGVEVEKVETIVAAALGATDGGAGYVSKARAEASGQTPTTSWTSQVLYGRHEPVSGRNAQSAREYNERLDTARAAAAGYLADGTVAAVIEAAAAITGDSEYADNVRILAACETVSAKNIGLVASFVAVWSRATAKAVERKVEDEAKSARRNEWFGTVGAKKVATEGTVTALRTIEGDYGTSLLIEWVTVDGFTCKWFASNFYRWNEGGQSGLGVTGTPVEVGTRIAVVGTIKRHEERNGFKATAFTRCTVAAAE